MRRYPNHLILCYKLSPPLALLLLRCNFSKEGKTSVRFTKQLLAVAAAAAAAAVLIRAESSIARSLAAFGMITLKSSVDRDRPTRIGGKRGGDSE